MFWGQTDFDKKSQRYILAQHWIFASPSLYFIIRCYLLILYKTQTYDTVKVENTQIQKSKENEEIQLNSNLSSNQQLPPLLAQSHLPAASSIQAQPLPSDVDQRVVTWNVFIYSQSPLKYEDSCFKLILCQGTNCHGKVLFYPLLLNASWYGNISVLTGIIQGFLSGSPVNTGLLCWFCFLKQPTESYNFIKQKNKCVQKSLNNPSEKSTSAFHQKSMGFIEWPLFYFSVWFSSIQFQNQIGSISYVNLLECLKELVLHKHIWY